MSRDDGSKGANSKNGSTPTTPSATKFCHILKRPDFEGYGFNLHTEKVKPGQYIGKVDAGSPAEAAGLKEGDRIVEVNGVNIGQETHKQVVQRIKAIANEVRLLLVDANGMGDATVVAATSTASPLSNPTAATTNGNSSSGNKSVNNNSNNSSNSSNNISNSNGTAEYQGTMQEMPGASANISSISMVSTKRSSNASTSGSASDSSSQRNSNAVDVTDRAALALPDAVNSHTGAAAHKDNAMLQKHNNDNNNMMNKMSTPPPPSAAIATVPTTPPPKQQPASANTITAATTPTPSSNGGNPAASRPGSLQLQMTAAEMRAKLMAKKKYDPKNENVDLRKKFEIIQKL